MSRRKKVSTQSAAPEAADSAAMSAQLAGALAMAEAAPDHTDSKHSVDELFQLLVRVRDIPPAIAKKQILEKLQLDKLRVNYHIRGGTRKTRPIREPTPEELRRFEALSAALHERKASREEMREEMDRAEAFLYEHVPPEGITEQVHFQSWGEIFRLLIRGGRLVVEPSCSLDYPWEAYSFMIASWSLVNELWPTKPPQPSLEPTTNSQPKSAAKTPRPGSADFWIAELFPNEAWRLLKPPRIHRAIEHEIENRNAELVQKAKPRNEKVTLLEHVSLTAVRTALKRRLER